LLLTVPLAAQAHSLRVLANRLAQEQGKKVTAYLNYGHLLPVDEVIAAKEVTFLQARTPSQSVKPLELTGRSLHSNEMILEETGVYQLESIRKTLVYTKYVESSGKPAFARVSKDQFKLPEGAKEAQTTRSRQYSKALLISGSAPGKAIAPLGHELEIVLESKLGSLGLDPGQPVKVQVLFQGKPLANAKVTAASVTLSPDGLPESATETDSQGIASLELPEPGTWLLEVTHLFEAAAGDKGTLDFESYKASLAVPVAEEG